MNQILSVENTKKKKSSGPIEINKIILFFAIVILLFGIGLIGKGSFAVYLSRNQNVTKDALPEVNITREGDRVKIQATHTKPIEKMVYGWNEEGVQEVYGNGNSTLEAVVELPVGNNMLHLKIIDIDGKERKFEKQYTVDATKPQLSITVENQKLKIVAKDNVALSYLTYRWDEGNEERVNPTEESKAQIETFIAIPVGQHTITVVAVNSNNLSETKSMEIKGVTEPKVWAEQQQNTIIIHATDEEALKEVFYTLNGKKYKIGFEPGQVKEVTYTQELQPGENRILIEAYNMNDVQGKFEGICTYTP